MDEDKKRLLAIASVIVGFIAIAGGICLAVCGAFLAVIGIVLGALAVKSDSKLIAIIGIVFNGLALVVVAANMVFTYGMMTGQVDVSGLPFPRPGAPAEVRDAGPTDSGPTAPTAPEPPSGSAMDAPPTALPLAPWPAEDEDEN